jgi:hypothetical protein
LVDELKANTVALVTRDEDGDISPFCTGVWVDKDKILTADHCARAPIEAAFDLDADDPEQREAVQLIEKGFKINYITEKDSTGLWREPKKLHAAVVEKFDYDHDLALLVVKDPKDVPEHRVAPLADKTPAQGEELHIMGHPTGLTWTYGHGYVAAYREEKFRSSKKTGPFLQVSGPAWHGSSGGGAFNNNGELVGIADFLTPAPHNVMFIHLETIRSFLGRPVPR